MNLTDYLIQTERLKTPAIIDAFNKIKRIDFLTEQAKPLFEIDQALPTLSGQTISQPTVVAFMLELLQPKQGDKILDIGSGSGWTSALLAQIVGKNGKIFAIEIIQELKEFGEKNVSKYNFIKKNIVQFICTDGSKGYKKQACFDKILVSASCENVVPSELKSQLKIGGRLVIPIKNSIWLFVKKDDNKFKQTEYPGFVFVPLVNHITHNT